MKIILSTASKTKRECLDEVLNELGVVAEIEIVQVVSGVADQPMTSGETKRGSINRAKKALRKFPQADFSIGIEVGYHPNRRGNYEMLCWATIVGKNKNICSAKSQSLVMPSFHQEVLKRGENLKGYTREYLETAPDLPSRHFGEIITFRKPLLKTAIKSALLYYLVK